MKFLRTVSTRRLLALIAALIAVIAAGTAIAMAASGSGPVPAKKPLARAIHDGLAAPKITGISADISFTNHLIDSSNLQGSDPILSGATGRLWLSSTGHRLRLELQSDHGQDAQVVVNGRSFWAYDPGANTVYEGRLPADAMAAQAARKHPEKIPSIKQIQSEINRVAANVNLSGAKPSDVAGQATYTVRVSPKHDGGLLGAGELAWDAVRGVPLRFAVYAQHQSSPVFELKATNVSYGAVSSSVFSVAPPSGAKTVRISVPTGKAAAARAHRARGGTHAEVHGVSAVAKRVGFKLTAPRRLVGLPRRSVTLLNFSGHRAALVTYGQNLGGIAVLEQTGQAAAKSSASQGGGDKRNGLSLPTISVNGATGQELDTALGTVVRFTRAGVTYTVLGSVPPAAAEAAARAL